MRVSGGFLSIWESEFGGGVKRFGVEGLGVGLGVWLGFGEFSFFFFFFFFFFVFFGGEVGGSEVLWGFVDEGWEGGGLGAVFGDASLEAGGGRESCESFGGLGGEGEGFGGLFGDCGGGLGLGRLGIFYLLDDSVFVCVEFLGGLP